MRLILASTSPYRKSLLARLGIPFDCVPPACDEELLKDASLAPRQLAEKLASAKAMSLRCLDPAAAILGSDQLATCEGRILGKPGTRECAIEQLLSLAAKQHSLITAVCLVTPEATYQHTDVTQLQMRALDRTAVERYVDADCPLDCAGSYKLEQRGITLFESIRSDDQTAITGLPLIAVTSLLRSCGFTIP